VSSRNGTVPEAPFESGYNRDRFDELTNWKGTAMSVSDTPGGFQRIRETVSGSPMLKLIRYCFRYGWRLSGGVIMAMITRISRLVPPLIVAVAIDRVISAPGEPSLLALFGLMPSEVVPAGATEARHALLFHLVLVAVLAYLVRSVTRFLSRYWLQSSPRRYSETCETILTVTCSHFP
jgi:ATP-binding cassette subfamily B protein